jgi:hypothetical protein
LSESINGISQLPASSVVVVGFVETDETGCCDVSLRLSLKNLLKLFHSGFSLTFSPGL